MRILFVSQYFYPETFKGNDIVFDFVKKGHDVTVLTAKPNYPKGNFYDGYSFLNKRKEIINGATVIRTPIYPRKNGKGINLILNYLSFIFFSYFACIFRIKGKFDLIFVQQLSPVTMALPGIWLKKRKKAPLYLWVLDLWPESIMAASNFKNNKIIKVIDKLVQYIYNNAEVILISSKYFEHSIIEKIKDKEKKIVYFPNWAEDIFTQKPSRQIEVPDLPKGFNIMFAGNVGEAQDFETILKAAQLTQHEDINWIIVGDGRKMDWVKNEIIKEKIRNVKLFGRYDLDSMPFFFKKADVLLVSLKDEPVFSLTVPAKIQAYMSSGKIILGVLNGEGNKLINDSECGFAVPAGDYLQLVNKAVILKNMTIEQRNKMEVKAKLYYKNNFDKEMLFENLESLFLNNLESR